MIRAAMLLALTLLSAESALAAGSSGVHKIAKRITCEQIRAAVAREGAIILHLEDQMFERVVATSNHCQLGEGARPLAATARDENQCFVGYTCEMPSGAQ